MSTDTDKDRDDPENKKLEHEGWDTLKDKKRGCTDCLCLFLLLAVWIAMTIVGFIACGVIENDNLKAGNPARLINAMDYRGSICGISASVDSKPFGYYLADGSAVCVETCPEEDNFVKFICKTSSTQTAANANAATGYNYCHSNECFVKLKSTAVLGRCVPDKLFESFNSLESFNATAAEYLQGNFDIYPEDPNNSGSNSGFVGRFLADVYKYQGYIFGFGIGIATVIAFGYLWFLRIPGLLSVIIWSIVLSIDVFLIVGAFLLWSLANTWSEDGEHSKGEVTTMRVFSYIIMGLFVLYSCFILVLGKRIALAINIVKEAARALGSMPILIFSPVFQILGMTVFLVPWFIYVLYLASSGEMSIDETTNVRVFTYDKNSKYAFIYMLFCWFWTSEFLIACGQLLIALSISCWYFTRDKSTTGNVTVKWAFGTLCRYHLGTAAFGSLIIAIILTIRAIISYIQRKAKKSGNKILEYAMCCLQCCMWCLEKIMRFLNKNAYIQTAIYGYSFCKAARSAFFLLLRNILRVAAVNMVADFVLLLGKMFVSISTTFFLYLIFAYSLPASEMNGLISPLVFTFLLAYFVSIMFSEIFGMGIETILLCFIADEELFPVEKRFAEGGLATALQKTAQAAAANKVVPVTPTQELEAKKQEELL